MRRAFSHRRDLLHASKLEEFVAWAIANGYRLHARPEKATYEVARLEKIDPSGNHPHIVIYRRTKGEHLTLCFAGVSLVRQWLNSKRKR